MGAIFTVSFLVQLGRSVHAHLTPPAPDMRAKRWCSHFCRIRIIRIVLHSTQQILETVLKIQAPTRGGMIHIITVTTCDRHPSTTESLPFHLPIYTTTTTIIIIIILSFVLTLDITICTPCLDHSVLFCLSFSSDRHLR